MQILCANMATFRFVLDLRCYGTLNTILFTRHAVFVNEFLKMNRRCVNVQSIHTDEGYQITIEHSDGCLRKRGQNGLHSKIF